MILEGSAIAHSAILPLRLKIPTILENTLPSV
jgi:hypothetical protein